jgi:hypothetical protein
MGADGSSFLRSIGAGDVHMSERVDGWTTDENCLADGTDTSFFILVEIKPDVCTLRTIETVRFTPLNGFGLRGSTSVVVCDATSATSRVIRARPDRRSDQ